MIKKEELLSIAKMKGLSPKFAELDYFQDISLLNICREFGSKLVFKGGTCLFKAYKLNRFSEDLDFTARKGFKPKDFFQRLPYFFGLLNINAKAKVDQFEKGTNVYLQMMGPLYDGRKETMATLSLNISLRERIIAKIQRFPYMPVYKDIQPFDLFVMDEKEILAEKARAIFGRNKARDVYDFWYLLKKKNLPLDVFFMKKKLSNDKIKFEKEQFLSKIDEKKNSWERDLAALVSGPLPPFNQVKKEIKEKLH